MQRVSEEELLNELKKDPNQTHTSLLAQEHTLSTLISLLSFLAGMSQIIQGRVSIGPKRLMIVVDGSAEMGPHWNAILDGYLQKIVRSFCGSRVENQATSVPELSYVQSHRGPLSEGPGSLPSGCTTDVDVYLNWLSNLTFDVSCDINSFSIGDCLANALLEMFGMNHNDDHDQYGGERHSILVAASNPFCSTDLQRTGSGIGTKRKRTDAESMAEYCRKLDVSLSVISPIDIPIFKKIYYAVNANILFRIIMQANPNSPAKNFKSNLNPDFVVLLSEKFVLARDALKEEEPTKNNLSELKTAPLNEIAEDFFSSNLSAATDFTTELDLPDLPPLSYDPSQFLSTSIPCLLTLSEDFIFEEMNSFGNTDDSWLPELEPIVSLSDPLIVSPRVMVSPHGKALPLKDSMGGTQRNVVEYQTQKTSREHQTENETTFRQVVDSEPHFAHEVPQNQKNRPLSTSNSSASVMKMPSQSSALIQRKGKRKQVSHERKESTSPVTPPTMPSRMLPGKPASLFNDLFGNLENTRAIGLQEMHSTHGLATPSAVHQSEPSAGSLNTISTGSSSSSSGQTGQSITPQHFAKIQCPTGQGNFPGAYPAKEGSSHNWSPMTSFFLSKLMSDIGMSAPMRQMHPILPRRIESTSAFGKQMPPEVDETMRSFFASDGQHFNLQEHNRYVKAWEGSIVSGFMSEKRAVITTVVAYRLATTPERITSDWPGALHLGRLLCQNYFDNISKIGTKNYLVFEASNTHAILEHLKTRKLCSNIKLPSQTMIFSPTRKRCFFIGTVFPGVYPIYRTKTRNSNCQQSDAVPDQEPSN